MKLCDENTIGVVAILGSTFDGAYEPVKEICDALDAFQAETGIDVPVHADGASGAMIAPFLDPDLEWDFRLPRVASINTSGHKYGLVYPGVGWVVWRDADALPEDLIFWVNYLGDNMPTFALNFSRPGAQVVAQYYNFLRLGYDGFRRVQGYARDVATRLSGRIAELGPFELLTRGDELPVFAFTLKDDIDNYTVFDVSNALRERGWQVPAYTFPENRTDLAALRVVVRRGFTHDLADMLVADLERQLPRLQSAADPGARRGERERLRALMCRWLAYSGSPVLLEDLLYKPKHSLIDQSLHSTMGAETTNGDGFGVGWYGDRETPGTFHSVEPAWSDRNLRDLAAHVRSGLVFAHIRATSGSPVQQTNCHPFRHGRWLWMHNGLIADFSRVKRELVLAIDPELYPAIEGSTDSEVFFFLALTLGLEDDPPGAVERAVGLIEQVGQRAWRRASDPDDGGDERRHAPVGVPLLERREVAVALLLHARGHASRAAPRGRRAARALRRVTPRRLRAPRRSGRRLERGARVALRRHPGAARTSSDPSLRKRRARWPAPEPPRPRPWAPSRSRSSWRSAPRRRGQDRARDRRRPCSTSARRVARRGAASR